MLKISSVEKSYAHEDGRIPVLQGVSLALEQGQTLALTGESGSGKSTLLHIAAGLESPDAGSVHVLEQDVTAMDDSARANLRRRDIALVFQQFNLWAHMSILQNVMEAPVTVLRRDPAEVEKSARAYLDKVGIGDKCDVYPAQLSGGQQQRAAIARALCMEPEALLFDEPTSALDPELEQEVVRVIKDLASEGRTMLIVTHDMKLAADVSDHVVFLHQGLIEEQGAPKDLFGAPKSERLRGFLSATHAA